MEMLGDSDIDVLVRISLLGLRNKVNLIVKFATVTAVRKCMSFSAECHLNLPSISQNHLCLNPSSENSGNKTNKQMV